MEKSISQPQVIVFIATVGSGKSTQMKLLAEYFKSNGLKTKMRALLGLYKRYLASRAQSSYALKSDVLTISHSA
jgi:thymidylate kinase